MKMSIQTRLPLFATVLLVAVAIAQLTIGFGEVRGAARSLADRRLQMADSALVELLQTSQQRARVTALAKDSSVALFLRSHGRRGRVAALAALRRVTPDTASNARLELRDFGGGLLLQSGRFGAGTGALVSPGTDSARIGSLQRRDSVIYFAVASAVGHEGAGGVIQLVAHLQLNPRTRRALTGLAGGDVTYLFGNAAGDPWTDFATVIPAPPERVRTSPLPLRYERGEAKRVLARAIPGTPWMVAAELPSRVIAAPARAYLTSMAPIAAAIVVVGALIAWWGSRRLTNPLRDLTRAAEAIEAGRLETRVPVRGSDELGIMARSFNSMAEQVARSHHHLESQVAERTRDLEGTNAELESFSYSVSHDLRAPLRAIHGFARILLEDHHAQLDPEAQRLLGVIDQNTRRMGQLIDDLLAFSRLGRKEISAGWVDMGELTRSVVDEVRRAEGERASDGGLHIRIDPLPPAWGDRALLRQVVSNLVQNAAKFTRGRDKGVIEIGAERNNGQTAYYVRDNGAGFDPRYADKLFGVFQRLHSTEEFDGTGVGLAIVKRIVERHAGRVWAEGQPDRGATFYFTVPAEEH